jgi:hypothetical protein
MKDSTKFRCSSSKSSRGLLCTLKEARPIPQSHKKFQGLREETHQRIIITEQLSAGKSRVISTLIDRLQPKIGIRKKLRSLTMRRTGWLPLKVAGRTISTGNRWSMKKK